MKTITNNQYRELHNGFWLGDKVRKEFDHYSDEEFDEEFFFKYKKQWYCLADFVGIDESHELAKIGEGVYSLSVFDAIIIKLSEDLENVKVIHCIF